jgi:Mrp family chromosome partitioning ATPase
VSTWREIIAETPPAHEQPQPAPSGEEVQHAAAPRKSSLHDEQIQALVQQLFFGRETGVVRHVGLAPVEASTATATLCLEVASALAKEGRFDVGLIDAHSDPVLLQTQLQIPSPALALTTWPVRPHLWMVPRQSWLADGRGQRVTDQNLWRLRELTAQFDFSILWCAPVSWLTANIGQACDGLVLVLTANKTRRLVAAQIKDQLCKARVPLLGTVLAERRFPVPQGLYRSL